jgi:aryl carrier-like protein
VGVTGKILPIGIPGELYISGKGVTSGYINQPELTSQKFLRNHFGSGDRVYRTGDLAVRLSDGNLVFKGRIDNQVKVRGFRMELDEIETNLCSIPEVESGCVTAFKGKQEEFDLCAYYVLKNGSQLTSEEIRFGLLGRIPVYMVPAYYMSLDSLPLTINGKIDRKRLPPVKFDRSQERAPLVSPRNEIETKLVRVFEDVLQNSPFGIDDNFFLCGGDSVKSIQICSRLRGQGLYVQVRDIIEGQTIRIIAQKIIQVESIEFPSAEIVPDEGKFTYENLPEGELELIKQALKNALKGNPI